MNERGTIELIEALHKTNGQTIHVPQAIAFDFINECRQLKKNINCKMYFHERGHCTITIPNQEKEITFLKTKNKYAKYGPGTTVVITKDGQEYIGSLLSWKPEENYLTIISGLVTIQIYFDNIKSAKEYGARVSINSPLEGEELDLLEKAKLDLKQGREKGWFDKDVPVKEWEKI